MKFGLTVIVFAWLISAASCLSTGESLGCGGPWSGSPCRCDDPPTHDSGDKLRSSEPATRGGSIRIRITKEPTSLLSMLDPDPVVRSVVDHDVLETLVRVSTDNAEIEPELAVSWNVDDDLKHYTFELNPKAQWHDGRPVTASDVQFTFSRLLDLVGQTEIQRELADVGEVIAESAHVVTLQLDRPRPDILFVLSALPILPAHIFGRSTLAKHPSARAPIGSGPFRFVRWVPGQLIELARNPNWRGSKPYLDRIEYRIVADNRVALDLFRRGDLDVVPGLPGNTKWAEKGSRLITYPLPKFEAWIYNTARPMFSRSATRSAVGMLIDRAAIRCSVLQCRADLLEGPWPPESFSSTDLVPPLPFDPTGAKELLEADGWVDRDGDGVRERGGIDFSFYLLLPDQSRELQRVAAVVQSDLAKAGIEMRIATVSLGTYLSRLKTRRFDASIIAVPTGIAFDPWSRFHSKAIDSAENFGAFSDSELDTMLDQLRAAESISARIEFMGKLNLKLRSAHPMTFTFRPHAVAVIKNHVQGVSVRRGWFEERLLRRTKRASGGKP
ncbi:MAG: peptide ABC transporter substrate-binding protein [Proteobacteria bacterium]|nr:peptide ABC transporter substrate-binding protein [Pseudomonadota bacterium]